MHPAEHKINDLVTLIAVGSPQRVLVLALTHESSQLLKEIKRPLYRSAQTEGEDRELEDCYPALQWGYGLSPALKDKCYATLVVAWGPLVQLYVLNNLLDDSGNVFIEDGYTVLPSSGEAPLSSVSAAGSVTLSHGLFADQKIEINPYEQTSRYEAIRHSENLRSSQIKVDYSPFEMQDTFIEQIWYLSESSLLVLTKSLEFKVLYTQRLDYGLYNHKKYDASSKTQEPKKGKPSQNFLVDEGVVLASLLPCPAENFSQSISVTNGQILALGMHGLSRFSHLSWDESLEAFKLISKGNWIEDFSRAIEIYTGQIKGFKEVPEDMEMRQQQMKGQLKLFVRTIITDQLDKWNQENSNSASLIDNPYAQPNSAGDQEVNTLDDSNAEILQQLDVQKKDARKLRYNNLIRIAIEFCVVVQDCYFLFYDLFLLFQEEQLEEIFLDELKPFIMAGRFSNWELPSDILQNHIVNYYKDPHKPEQIEKIIINLNLADCPDDEIVNLIQFAEQNFLSTALVSLHTAAYNRKETCTCIHVILSLLELYKQAKDSNPGSFEELKEIDQLPADSIERL